MELPEVRAFVRVAELQSISAAARALGLPKSSVSRFLIRLEAALGSVLVERSPRHLRLTDAGLLFLPHARRILNDVDEAETALGSFKGVPRGELRVNAPQAFALGLIAPMLPGFLVRYPGVRLVLDVTDRQIDMPVEQADLVIRIRPLVDSTLIARRLTTLELWACASPAYLRARGTPGSAPELAGHDLVGRVDRFMGWVRRASGGLQDKIETQSRAVVTDPSILENAARQRNRHWPPAGLHRRRRGCPRRVGAGASRAWGGDGGCPRPLPKPPQPFGQGAGLHRRFEQPSPDS